MPLSELAAIYFGSFMVGFAAFAVLLAIGGMVITNLLRQHARLHVRLESLEERCGGKDAEVEEEDVEVAPGIPVGSQAPTFVLPGLRGELLTLEYLRAVGKPVMLFFAHPGCGPCRRLVPELETWEREYGGELTIAVLSEGSFESNYTTFAGRRLRHILVQKRRDVSELYHASATPSAMIVRPDGTVGSRMAAGDYYIRALVREFVRSADAEGALDAHVVPIERQSGTSSVRTPSRPTIELLNDGANRVKAFGRPDVVRRGERTPSLALPDLDGRVVNLADVKGRETAVVFWNPSCSACGRLLPELKEWELSLPGSAPQLLIVSTGDVDATRSLGLRARVLLDPDFAAGRAFGANGTPMAVLLDRKGHVASDVASGGESVMRLARGGGASQAVPQQPPVANGNGSGNDEGAQAVAQAVPVLVQQGQRAPALTLPDLTGRPLNLADLKGSRTLLIFWNPGCGFCSQMLPELKAWEANKPKSAPKIVVISTDDQAANRALGLRSRVLLDASFAAATAFGANGTPTAVLLDSKGRVASEVAAGASAVMTLARGDMSVVTGHG